MMEPFAAESVRGGISFGPSAYGYDFRLGREFKRAIVRPGLVMDPKADASQYFEDFVGDICEIPARGFVLGRSLEYFRIPRNILAITFGKSTYARSGIHLNVTPAEPEWEGYLTIAIHNHNSIPARIYAGEGIGQMVFLEAKELCQNSYADKKGKYQGQKEITVAKGRG